MIACELGDLFMSGYSPLLQLPDGTVLNAPHVAVETAGGVLATHPKVVSVAPDRRSVVFMLTEGFSQGQPIVYISTGEQDAYRVLRLRVVMLVGNMLPADSARRPEYMALSGTGTSGLTISVHQLR
jgi:hypothetical protein